jgi:hypothetical protein
MDPTQAVDLSAARDQGPRAALKRAMENPHTIEHVLAHIVGVAELPERGKALVVVRPDGRQTHIHLQRDNYETIAEQLLAPHSEDLHQDLAETAE